MFPTFQHQLLTPLYFEFISISTSIDPIAIISVLQNAFILVKSQSIKISCTDILDSFLILISYEIYTNGTQNILEFGFLVEFLYKKVILIDTT